MTDHEYPTDHALIVVGGVERCGFWGGEATGVTTEPHATIPSLSYDVTVSVMVTIQPCGHSRIEPVTVR